MNKKIDISNIMIKTERLLLRPFRLTDLDDFYEYAKIDGVGQMAGWSPHKDKKESKKILEMFINGRRTFALVLKDKVIGSFGLDEYKTNEFPEYNKLQGVELGYVLGKDYWGNGYMPEAVEAVISYLFDIEKLDFIICGHFEWNKRSKRVIEKNGFKMAKKIEYQTDFGKIEIADQYVLFNPKKDNRIKMMIFDIDGTLIPFGSVKITPSALEAIEKIKQQKGVKVMIATGRSKCFIQDDIFESLHSDYLVTINGQSILDKDLKSFIKHTISLEDMDRLTNECVQNGIALAYKYDDELASYNLHDEYCSIYLQNEERKYLVKDYTKTKDYHLIHGLPISAFLIGDESVIEEISKKFSEVKFVKAYPLAYEVYNAKYNKSTAIEEVLKILDLTWNNCMVFGDADNDIDMIQKARIGIAMANGSDNLKAEADYIAADIADDGVAKAIEYFKIEF
ncbi:MAG: Cof-type HAD-IIB family hydrolase [Erysipelotrichaceae bacterium]|jgi:ribosomal-protein-alanine N-acetyltransferase